MTELPRFDGKLQKVAQKCTDNPGWKEADSCKDMGLCNLDGQWSDWKEGHVDYKTSCEIAEWRTCTRPKQMGTGKPCDTKKMTYCNKDGLEEKAENKDKEGVVQCEIKKVPIMRGGKPVHCGKESIRETILSQQG